MSGSTAERGYGAKHQAERSRWALVVARGDAWCAELVCLMRNRWIRPGSPWDLAHDREHGGYLGPAHRRCNRAEGARFRNRGGRRGGSTPLRPSRRWVLRSAQGEGGSEVQTLTRMTPQSSSFLSPIGRLRPSQR